MADPNPLDALFHSDTDESVVNALVASLESKLASPTNRDHSQSVINPSVNANHVNNSSSIQLQAFSEHGVQNNNVHLSNSSGNINNSNAKTIIKDNQILGINSIHTSSPVMHVNSPVNSHRTASPKPLNSVNKPSSPVVHVLQSHANQTGSSVQLGRTTPSPIHGTVINTTLIHTHSPNIQSISHPHAVTLHNDVINRTSPSPHNNVTSVQQGLVQQQVVRNPQGVVISSNSQQFTQKTNVHIVHSANATSMVSQPGSNPVITVRGPAATSQITTLRPQIVTSTINTSSPRPQGNVRIQTANRMPNAPIRIAASSQPSQINIAPRPGTQANTITLPPGLVPGPGAVLMKNEHGQIVLVQQGAIAGQHNVSSVAISTSNTPHKVQYVRHPTANTAQRLPTGQIVHIQHGAPSPTPTAVRQAMPSPVNAVRTQQPVRVAAPQGGMQTVMRTSTPTAGSQAAAAANAQQQAMIDNVKKCKNFLSTLIKLAASQPEATVSSVRDLIQGLIDGKLEPELFTERLQKELKSSPQPYLVPFLKKSLPLLRQSLLNNKMSIDGVKPPPPEIVQQSLPVSVAPVPTAVSHPQQ
ncbi:hypothetical protein DPMN_170366, partial [Dreissena polymorpha]